MKTQNIILISLLVISITTGLYLKTNTMTTTVVEGYYNPAKSNSKTTLTNLQLGKIIALIILMILGLSFLAASDNPRYT